MSISFLTGSIELESQIYVNVARKIVRGSGTLYAPLFQIATARFENPFGNTPGHQHHGQCDQNKNQYFHFSRFEFLNRLPESGTVLLKPRSVHAAVSPGPFSQSELLFFRA